MTSFAELKLLLREILNDIEELTPKINKLKQQNEQMKTLLDLVQGISRVAVNPNKEADYLDTITEIRELLNGMKK